MEALNQQTKLVAPHLLYVPKILVIPCWIILSLIRARGTQSGPGKVFRVGTSYDAACAASFEA